MVDPRVFSSRRDAWFSAVMAVFTVVMVFSAAAVLMVDRGPFGLAYLVIVLAACGFALWISGGTHYTFSGDRLVVRSGPFAWRLAIADIESATPSRNPLSSPALSLDRLMLSLKGGGFLLVSPLDKEGFVAELTARQGPRPTP